MLRKLRKGPRFQNCLASERHGWKKREGKEAGGGGGEERREEKAQKTRSSKTSLSRARAEGKLWHGEWS